MLMRYTTKVPALDNLGKHTEGILFVNKAIMLSDKALSIDPYNVDLLAIKGRAFNRLQNYTEAIKYFDKALAIDPTYKYALANKGVALNKLGNYSEAIRYYDKALDIDPKFVYALSGKGDTLSNQGNYTEARKYYEKALNISPNYVSVLINIGNIFYNQGNYTEARQYSDKVLALSSSSSSSSSPINQNKDQQSLIGSNNHPLAEYTFMVYMVGSDLEAKSYAATQNIRQMENIGSTSNVNIIIETGGGNDQTIVDGKRFIDFTKVQRHKILHNNIQTLADLGHQQNMGDPHTLSDFIVWSVSNFPAKKYAIILWDHGSGINGFGGDLQFDNDKLTIDEIHQGFADTTNLTSGTRGFELIGFDSCLMASIEVANSIEPFGNYMVSSEEIEPQWGWDYSFILRIFSYISKSKWFITW